MQGIPDQVLSREICMKVVECVQIVCKMKVSILHTALDTLCCLLLHGVGVLEHVVAHLTRAEESVALWTPTNKLLLRHRIHFVLGESDCLAIYSARGDSEGSSHGNHSELQHPLPYLYRYLLSEQHRPNYRDVGILRTCDCSESSQMGRFSVSYHSALYSSRTISNMYMYTFPQILLCLPKNTVIHQFEEVL